MDGKDYATALRQIADWYEAHSDAPFSTSLGVSGVDTKEAAEGIARSLGSCRKEHSGDFFTLARDFSGVDLRFIFYRSTVCERVVVGTEDVPERFEPAHTREKVEWRCAPIFQEGG